MGLFLLGVEPSSSLSLTLLFEGNNELPGFHIMSQEELIRELLHLGGHIQVFALHVRGERVLEAERHKNSCLNIKQIEREA